MSPVVGGDANRLSFPALPVLPVVAEKQNVVANSKKDMQNTFFIAGEFSWPFSSS
jgi:hypothetical protein